ncbi:MAG: hypothetical protein HOI25_02715 [Proteobacteria bacterium]|jgi:hypothetical protein|nr:hypothetical protein [Pseudomonadota bacterium]MBT6890660.1 hypothetical protein [Gammaproteobacteria bacterium]
MSLSEHKMYPDVDVLMEQIEAFDLHRHVVELQAYGLTIVPPEKLRLPEGFVVRLRSAIIAACERRNNIQLGDFKMVEAVPETANSNSWDLLEEDKVFIEAATNSVCLTLVRWLLGQSAILSGQSWIIKGKGGGALPLHNDNHGIPPGSGSIAHMCNTSWICTDYINSADGPTVFVPGSHNYGRATLAHESDLNETPYKYFPLIAEAGSLAVWNGNTWHASEPRTSTGFRVTLVQTYMRSYMRPQTDYSFKCPPELLEKNPELERIAGKPLNPFADSRNPDPERIAPFMRAGTSPFA